MLKRILAIAFTVILLISINACKKNQTGYSGSVEMNNSSVESTYSNATGTQGGAFDNIDQALLDKYSYKPQITEIMPSVHINTLDGSNSFATDFSRNEKLDGKINYIGATVSVSNCDAGFILNNIEAEVKVRGNYTLNYDKKPIRIKFGSKQSMLGLHNGEKYKNWVLLADWKDLSMLNNAVSFYLGKQILGSDGYYCTDFRNVELYLNDEYWGVYLLCEQQEIENGRMSVPEAEDGYTDTDIGYLFEFDGYYVQENQLSDGLGDPTFTINYYDDRYEQIGYTVKSDINSTEQLEFLQNYVSNAYLIAYAAAVNDNYFEFNEDYTDIVQSKMTSAKEVVAKVIDIQSLVDTYILHEIACDPDIDWSSFYMTLDMSEDGSKSIVFEAPWDFDSAYGIKKKFTSANGLFAADNLNPWLSLLSHEDWFIDMVKQKWNELLLANVPESTLMLIKEHKSVYEKYYAENYTKWSKRVKYGNGELSQEVNSFKTQAEAADYLYNWLDKRFDYLSSQWEYN